MYNISEQLKNELEQTYRDYTDVEIKYGLIDVDAPDLSSPTDNGHMSYSNVELFDTEEPIVCSYDTLEINRFVLDGLGRVGSSTGKDYQGYISSAISDENGVFETNPTITITFSDYVKMVALTVLFDEIRQEFPKELVIKTYKDTVLQQTHTRNPTSVQYICDNSIEDCNKIVIEFTKTYLPHRRIRVNKLIYGIMMSINTDSLSDISLSNKLEPISFELPIQELDFNIFDTEYAYDPEKPDSLLQYIEAGQEVTFNVKHHLSDGTLETIPMSTTYSTGTPSVSDNGVAKVVNIKTSSYLDFMENTFDELTYSSSGYTYYELIEKILQFVVFPRNYYIDDSLKNLRTTVLLKDTSAKEYLQIIANACSCYIYLDRNGDLHVRPTPPVNDEFVYDGYKMISDPIISRTPVLRNLASSYSSVSVETNESEINTTDVTVTENTEFVLNYDPSTTISYTVTGLTVVGTPKIFATKMVIVLNGTGKIIVTGKLLKVSNTTLNMNCNAMGDDLFVENELISDKTQCITYMNTVRDYYKKQNTYSFDDRGFPQIELNDLVGIETNYGDIVSSRVVESYITFNGALSGSTKVLAEKV